MNNKCLVKIQQHGFYRKKHAYSGPENMDNCPRFDDFGVYFYSCLPLNKNIHLNRQPSVSPEGERPSIVYRSPYRRVCINLILQALSKISAGGVQLLVDQPGLGPVSGDLLIIPVMGRVGLAPPYFWPSWALAAIFQAFRTRSISQFIIR